MNNSINENLIAPCGMDCGLCKAHLREKNKCPGCRQLKENIPVSIERCKMRSCTERTGKYCDSCKSYPCDKLKQLDKRYREKYDMSQIENLNFISSFGIDGFIKQEEWNYVSDKGTKCIHDKQWYK